MKTFKRILAVAAIGSGILGILLAIVSVIGIWQLYNPLVISLDRLLYTADKGLEIVDRGLGAVDPLVGLLANSMAEIQETGDTLAAQIEESDPIIDTLSLLLGEDIGPKVDQVLSTLGDVRAAAEQVNTAAQTISSLPFIEIPRIGQATQGFIDLMNEIERGLNDISTLVDDLKKGISQEVIDPIQDRAAEMEGELKGLQTEIQTTHSDVKNIHQAVTVIRPMLPTVIGGIAVLLTVQLLWGAFAQIGLIYLAWIYLKFGRLDLHNALEPSSSTEPSDTLEAPDETEADA